MKLSTFYRIEIAAGLLYDAVGKTIPKADRDTALASILRVACELFGGATILPASGRWEDPASGLVAAEPSLCLVVLTPKGNKTQQKSVLKAVGMLADVVKGTLGQSAVLVSLSEVRAAFV